jgi:mRNA-degrading endonuclease RelE of RelBE toxin-antitoxin system
MGWTLRIARRAEKALAKIPGKSRRLIIGALQEMQLDPFSGDIVRLTSERSAWRRRVGSYRIFFDIDPDRRYVDIVEITRRTSTTY